MGTPAENKALVVRFLDALRVGDVATAAECFDADHYYSHTYEADLAGTWAQQKANFRAQIWTDADHERVALVAEDDRVAYQAKVTATHSGEYLGIPATGMRIAMDVLEIWRIDGNKIVEHWGGFQVTPAVMARLQAD